MQIRRFDRDLDAPALETCIACLQDFSRAYDPRMPRGELIARQYLTRLQADCQALQGEIFVAEDHGAVIGFVTVVARVPVAEPADGVVEEARIVDLFVVESARGRGVGKQLVARAAKFAAIQGARWLRVSVFAWNRSAVAAYHKLGFSQLEVAMEMDLASHLSSA